MVLASRRSAVFVWLVVLALAVGLSSPGSAAEQVTVERIGGADRYETAALVARETFPTGPNRAYDVYVARGDLFPDALAASYLAGYFNGGGPIVLTSTHSLHPATRAVIEDMAWRVWIMGDRSAVSLAVEEEIRAIPNVQEVIRVQGSDRYDTASSAEAMAPDHGGTAFLATGTDFADALAAGPLAYFYGMPLLLTPADRLHEATRISIEERMHEVIIVGGTAAVSSQVESEVKDACRRSASGCTVRRIGGADRTETATLLADEFVARRTRDDPTWKLTHVNLTRGDVFPDAAAGGPHGGEEVAQVLLTVSPHTLGTATEAWLEKHRRSIESIHVFGTRDAVSDRVAERARQAATE